MNEATQTGAAMAAIGMVGTVVGLLIGYLKDRDKLRYDAEFAKIRAQQERCEEESKKCNEEHAIAKREIANLHARDKTDKVELQSQIDAMRKAMTNLSEGG